MREASLSFLLFGLLASHAWAQCAPATDATGTPPVLNNWEETAGGKMSFEVASVRPAKSNVEQTSNFPLGPGNGYAITGGRFCATSTTLLTYIAFAYKLNNQQLQPLTLAVPEWVTTERFDIEAKGPANATKDQMRLMMQALLADRFKLRVHRENRQTAALALVVSKAGKLGPQLKPHPADDQCTTATGAALPASPLIEPSATSGLQLPSTLPCGGINALPPRRPGLLRVGARNVPLTVLSTWATNRFSGVDRAVFDRSGLKGNYDFSLEFSIAPDPANPERRSDEAGPSFMQALREQLGLRLESINAQIEVIVVDSVFRPSEN